MSRKYTILSVLMIILALGLVILPKKNDRKEQDPKNLLTSITQKSRYLSVDMVTHRIIENDPTLLLIDIRPAELFRAFALPGAVNIQPDSLLSATALELMNQPGKDKVLISNADLDSEKAWLISSRYSVNRIYVMKGGMNEWFNTIIKGQAISATVSTTDLELANFRNAARQYFTGENNVSEVPVTAKPAEKVTVTRKAPATSGGGC